MQIARIKEAMLVFCCQICRNLYYLFWANASLRVSPGLLETSFVNANLVSSVPSARPSVYSLGAVDASMQITGNG